ncbi:MAG: DNA polymerase II large subunit [Candidatus Bathyarchaeota archaeon]|nr:DNA polymerase II large subunit [Candidatus Bathyarchaeota archaeon]
MSFLGAKLSKENEHYVASLTAGLNMLYEKAEKARRKGLDPTLEPESEMARDLAELVEGLVGPSGVAESIRELSKRLPREELAFKIAEQIVNGNFGHMTKQSAAEQAIRTSLAILTEGITAAPLQGVAKVCIKQNFDRDQTKYLAIYYAGPIRSAGGTDQALTLIIGDFVRGLLGLARYKPTEEEINRFIEEMRLFERSIGRFQYHVTDSQLRMAIESIPIEVTGTESDPVDVQTFRDLPRIETNHVRGGALRVVNDGIIGRAAKVSTIVDKIGIESWDWLKRIGEAKGVINEKKIAGFMEDIIAGRPVFSFPSHPSGFRLRYGRARNTGLAAIGINPLTMSVLNQFLAGGTQVRIELPGKGGVVLPVDTIEPPIVLLEDGAVIRVTAQNLSRVKSKIKKILFLGDLLISFGDFLYNNKKLHPSGFTEEWWSEEVRVAIARDFSNAEEAAVATNLSAQRLSQFLSDPFRCKPNVAEAFDIAEKLNTALHPSYTLFWQSITTEDLRLLKQWITECENRQVGKRTHEMVGSFDKSIKNILERLCCPHRVCEKQIILDRDEAYTFAKLLLNSSEINTETTQSSLETIKNLSNIIVRAKAPTTIGARMGRPEKAKRRDMRPHVNVLFPIGLAGGSRRNLILAAKNGVVNVELIRRFCPRCQEHTLRIKCPRCETESIIRRSCPRCSKEVEQEVCPSCEIPAHAYERQRLDIKAMVTDACQRLGVRQPHIVKAVRGLSNSQKIPEIIEKGILRAQEDLSIYKDGTIRFDATNAPLTHFKPTEVKVSVDKLRQLGYVVDFRNQQLISDEQICELRAQDIVLPQKSAAYFVRVARFVDQLLESVYDLPKFYKVKKAQDLVGHLVLGLAPHTSVGILGRIIGFTDLDVCYAHPVWHSAKRRDCDGDEDAIMLTLDTLLNFSKSYLPSQIGGIMDAPLFIIPVVNPKEVQRQAHEFDVASKYPIEFYAKAKEKVGPSKVANLVELIADKLGDKKQLDGFGFTTPVSNINMGNRESMYKKLKKMTEKLDHQMELAEKIKAVNSQTVALKVLTTHFMRDISGNLRAFTSQGFRCKQCGKRFRRMPLKGRCTKCRGSLSLTVYRGGIEKYLDAAQHLIEKYGLPKYYLQRLSLVEQEITSLFEGRKPRQISLENFA